MKANERTIYYDASCGLCAAARTRFGRALGKRGFAWVPLQTAGVPETLGLRASEDFDEMKVRTAGGDVIGGAEAMAHLSQFVWWAWPLYAVSRMPGAMRVLRPLYRSLARNRHRISGACGLAAPREGSLISPVVSVSTELADRSVRLGAVNWLVAVLLLVTPVLVLAGGAGLLGSHPAAWKLMWCIALGEWSACKWVMWRSTPGSRSAKPRAAAGYFLGWTGTDAKPFVAPRGTGAISIARGELREALVRIASGAALVWMGAAIAARELPSALSGWVGMIGLIMLTHFGMSKALSVFWRRRGVAAIPIMNSPGRAVSLGDFWSRWNRGFRDIAYRFVFRPVLRRSNLALATLATFGFSGVLHDLVISIPARGGYGRPTLYFLIQAVGVLWEKSRLGRRVPAWLRRAVMVVVLLAPLPLLFPPVFVERVALPFLRAIGAFQFAVPTVSLTALIFAGGLLHFGILVASALVPQVLDWRGELRKLAPISRQLVWVHGAFIVLTIIGLGTIATLNAAQLASGATPLGRCVAAFIAIFWGLRLALQFVLFDPGPLLTRALLKLGYHGLSFVFAYLVAVFGWAAIA